MSNGPLAGVRVVDACGDLARSAGRLLAELGADVIRLLPGTSGPSLGRDADTGGGVLDWWFDTNCRRIDLDPGVDLASAAGRELLRDLTAGADLLVESVGPGIVDHAALRRGNPSLVHVAVSPFGATGPRAHWRASDLVAAAAGGMLSVCGLPDEPTTIWGRQMDNLAGFYAATVALAGLHRVRNGGPGLFADLSQQQAVVSCTEHLMMFWWYPEPLAPFGAPVAARQASLHWSRGYEVVPCRRGACMVSPSAGGVPDLLAWMRSEGFALQIPTEMTAIEWFLQLPAIMAELRAFALTKDATELFERGQALHVPFGEALVVPQVTANPQLAARGFFRRIDGAPEQVRLPGPAARFGDTPAPTPVAPRNTTVAEVVEGWSDRPSAPDVGSDVGSEPANTSTRRPLEGLRILDFTHVLAGPFATRILGDLGAEVVKIQTEARSQGPHANEYPYFAMWHRNKVGVTLQMKHPEALGVFRTMVEQADVVIDNFSAGVLEEWGAGHEVLASWNPRIISISMTGAGEDGPWREFVTFAPTVHALCGLTALSGPVGRIDVGTGVALNDHVSGIIGATLVLAAVEARARTGRGQHLDVSQLELGASLVAPALMDHLATGRVAEAAANTDPFAELAWNDVVRCADGEWLAVTAVTAEEAARARALLDAAPSAVAAAEALQAAGIAASHVQNARHLTGTDPQLQARAAFVELPSDLFGTQHTERFPAVLHDDDGDVELRYRPSPAFGEHNFELYERLLGWEADRIAQAMADGLFG